MAKQRIELTINGQTYSDDVEPRTLLVDTSRRPRPRARELADAMGASYVPLPFADAAKISATVRSNVA